MVGLRLMAPRAHRIRDILLIFIKINLKIGTKEPFCGALDDSLRRSNLS